MSDRREGAGNRTLTAVTGLRVGHADDREARTGCTAVVGPFRAAVEVRGLATGSRELDALSPLHVVPRCDALLLTGGSAFGLAAADGVVAWLEERGRGFVTSAATVPIVPAAVLYDLGVGDPSVRPGPAMGRAAAESADDGPVAEGSVGAGCGATVGKLRGGGTGDLSGLGSWADGEEGHAGHAVAALAAVNAFGDVVDGDGGILAGARDERGELLDTARALRSGWTPPGFVPSDDAGPPASGPGHDPPDGGGGAENTTLAVVATDAPLDRSQLRVVARQAMNGLVRRVRPASTIFDGDMVFVLSTADEARDVTPAELLRVSVRAEAVLERAVERAVRRGDVDPS